MNICCMTLTAYHCYVSFWGSVFVESIEARLGRKCKCIHTGAGIARLVSNNIWQTSTITGLQKLAYWVFDSAFTRVPLWRLSACLHAHHEHGNSIGGPLLFKVEIQGRRGHCQRQSLFKLNHEPRGPKLSTLSTNLSIQPMSGNIIIFLLADLWSSFYWGARKWQQAGHLAPSRCCLLRANMEGYRHNG